MGESTPEGQQAGQSSSGNEDGAEQIKYPGTTGNGDDNGENEEQIKYPG